jgi:dolichol-phosphate mannosyltransferase
MISTSNASPSLHLKHTRHCWAARWVVSTPGRVISLDRVLDHGSARLAESRLPVHMDGDLELSVVVATYRERNNIPELVSRVERALGALTWELTVVDDDSPDKTADLVREFARRDPRVRCVQRIGRRGLASACMEGMLSSAGAAIVVMDADLQHDETQIPIMLSQLLSGATDIVIASRYVNGLDVGYWDSRRVAISLWANRLSRLVCRQTISDPMSGFFMIRRSVLDSTVHRLSGIGFKILLDILVSAPKPLCVREVPYTFRPRFSGQSKLDGMVAWEFGMLILDKLTGGAIPARFIAFTIVGAAGVAVHMTVLTLLLKGLSSPFRYSQAVATVAAMVFNYAVNNVLTYRDRRLRGWSWAGGLLTFMLACGFGALANVGLAAYLFERQSRWFIAALCGIAVSAVWNYAVTRLFTWRDLATAR